MTPHIHVQHGDILEHECDMLVLKYAQEHYGADEVVARALARQGFREEAMKPQPGGYRVVEPQGAIPARSVMFAGVEPISTFSYRQIRMFARKALEDITGRDPGIKVIAFTMHGPGYGLDEREAFESLIAGLMDAVTSGDIPHSLEEITVVERNPGRARRLTEFLSELRLDPANFRGDTTVAASDAQERLREVGYSSDGKPHVFVAMPFNESKSDHYHYGIQGAVNNAGYLCERIDLDTFTGDVLERIKKRISGAALVIADLSGANPNVYLEVGYAWGTGIPTVLLTDDIDGLRFDVQGQRCLAYASIRDLEEKLAVELGRLGDH